MARKNDGDDSSGSPEETGSITPISNLGYEACRDELIEVVRQLEQGGLEEASALEGLDPALPAAKLLGLRPLQALAAGRLAQAEALDAAITATRQFAKRQMTWFRHRMPHYIWFDPLSRNLITEYERISA